MRPLQPSGKAYDLQNRLIEFAVTTVNIVSRLDNDPASFHLGRQLLRSGTSPALNYAEAIGAESRKDFVHKLKICLKELRESAVCLAILTRLDKIAPDHPAHSECDQLIAIMTKSIKTATLNMNNAY